MISMTPEQEELWRESVEPGFATLDGIVNAAHVSNTWFSKFYYRNCINAQPRERYCEFGRKVWCPIRVFSCRFLTLRMNRTEKGKQPYI